MRSLDLGRYTLYSCIAAAMLVGCGASQQQIGAPGAMPQSYSTATHADRGKSWMQPEALGDDLLYVTSFLNDTVYVYSYPTGALVGTLTGFNWPLGECVDGKGDVFIVNQQSSNIIEYAHGGTTPIQTLSDTSYSPDGCSVDPLSGNLAVANAQGPGSRLFGNVAIFQNAAGNPTYYSDPNIYWYYFCGYDNNGNLFVDGNNESSPIPFAELPKGSSTFTDVALSKDIAHAGAIQWDGKHLAVGYGGIDHNEIYQVSISGSSGTVVGTTELNIPRKAAITNGAQFWVQGNVVIVPLEVKGDRHNRVGLWSYPAGGNIRKTILVPVTRKYVGGITVSLAPK
jgi:hypothetical protein